MGQSGAPSGGVVGGHGGHDLGDVPAGHRPQHPLAESWIRGTDHACGDVGSSDGEDLGGGLRIEPADQCGEPGCVEVVHGGFGCGQLYGMPSVGGQVQVGPGYDVAADAGRQSGKAQSPEHRVESDLDSDQFESAVNRLRERDVGDPCESLPDDVDDLGVEHVPNEQDLVVAEGF